MELRTYQQEAVNAVYHHLQQRNDNPCVVLPTGSGKTPVIATICRDAVTRWKGRVLVLAHVKELLEQSADTLKRFAPELPIGVYSAGLKSRDTNEPVIIAGIQSVAERACELGKFNLIIVDEVHMLPLAGEGRYRTFWKDAKIVNPNVRLIGLTATPYRMDGGWICHEKHILNHVCYEKGIKELIREGFLCSIHTKVPQYQIDCSKLNVRHGEFVALQVAELFDNKNAVHTICKDIVTKTISRKSVLVFASSVHQAELARDMLYKLTGNDVGLITGETKSQERSELIARFQGKQSRMFDCDERLKYLVNVNVLTTGFDAPNVDCIAIMRPTASPGLYYQMVGRGFRIHETKTDCLVLDYGSNIQRHGPVDAIKVKTKNKGTGAAPVKECPECCEVVYASVSVCPDCGYEWVGNPAQPNTEASNEGILSGQKTESEHEVHSVFYTAHKKKGWLNGDPVTLRVDYQVGFAGTKEDFITTWVCPEHEGYARQKFVAWWKKRTDIEPPFSIDECLQIARHGLLTVPQHISVIETSGEFFKTIIENDFVAPKTMIDVSNSKTCGTCAYYDVFGTCPERGLDDLSDNSPACKMHTLIEELVF